MFMKTAALNPEHLATLLLRIFVFFWFITVFFRITVNDSPPNELCKVQD